MKATRRTSKIRDVAPKPIKLEQTIESPTIQNFTGKKFNGIHTEKKKVRPGIEPLIVRSKGDSVTSTSANGSESSSASIIKEVRKANKICCSQQKSLVPDYKKDICFRKCNKLGYPMIQTIF